MALFNLDIPTGIQKGQRVLVNGAGGGMGSFAVQIAKHYGAEVTGVDRADKLEFVTATGADHVFDYRRKDFTKAGVRYDLIIDLAAHHSIFDVRRAMAPNGWYRLVGGSGRVALQAVVIGPLLSRLDRRKLGILMAYPKRKELIRLAELLQAGVIHPVIDRIYPLAETAKAVAALERGYIRGKAVIAVSG